MIRGSGRRGQDRPAGRRGGGSAAAWAVASMTLAGTAGPAWARMHGLPRAGHGGGAMVILLVVIGAATLLGVAAPHAGTMAAAMRRRRPAVGRDAAGEAAGEAMRPP